MEETKEESLKELSERLLAMLDGKVPVDDVDKSKLTAEDLEVSKKWEVVTAQVEEMNKKLVDAIADLKKDWTEKDFTGFARYRREQEDIERKAQKGENI